MMKKYSKYLLYILLILFLYGAHLFFANNGGNNVRIQIKNESTCDTVYMVGYWDDEVIFDDRFLRSEWYRDYTFNTMPGKRTMTLKSYDSNGLIGEKRMDVWVLPLKYFVIEYYGKYSNIGEIHESDFYITMKSTPITIH